jgi:hypothetical protein
MEHRKATVPLEVTSTTGTAGLYLDTTPAPMCEGGNCCVPCHTILVHEIKREQVLDATPGLTPGAVLCVQMCVHEYVYA